MLDVELASIQIRIESARLVKLTGRFQIRHQFIASSVGSNGFSGLHEQPHSWKVVLPEFKRLLQDGVVDMHFKNLNCVFAERSVHELGGVFGVVFLKNFLEVFASLSNVLRDMEEAN